MIMINGQAYPAKEITFNDFCTFEDLGVDIQSMEKKPLSFLRVYVALCMESNLDDAGMAIQEHIANGGKMEDLLESMGEAIQESGFFRTQQPTEEEVTPKSETKK